MTTRHPMLKQMDSLPVLPDSLAIWGLGQMGVAIKGPEGILYIDACLSDIVRDVTKDTLGDWWARGYPPPLLPEEVTNASFYLCSHEHIDHLDPQTAGPVAKASPNAIFVTPGWCNDILADLDIGSDRILNLRTGQTVTLPGTSAKITGMPAAHYEREFDEQKGDRWIGFLIEWNGVTFYHAGDTIVHAGYVETLRSLPKADIAMLPVNGRDYFREMDADATGNLLPQEAARLARDLQWDVLIPGHNDLYPSNAIPFAEITSALERITPRQKTKQLQPGELYYYVKSV